MQELSQDEVTYLITTGWNTCKAGGIRTALCSTNAVAELSRHRVRHQATLHT